MSLVVITGGASGIGRGMAQSFAELGHRVVIGDIKEEAGQRTAREIGVRFLRVDVTSATDVTAFIDAARADACFDVLIANVGRNDGLPTARTKPTDWDRSIRVNLSSMFYTCRTALPYLSPGGSIIMTSSLVGVIGQRNSSAYAAAKGGIIAYVKALALELAPRKITVNAIAPGDVMTPAYEKWLKGQPPDTLVRIQAQIPLGRFAAPEEIGALAVFLASARFITGQTIIIDGGKSLGR
ncbi:MAG: SDR family oxidoreductase [Candidatus Sungbacteria bacterium]|uniref:SDR family oxidoreductase n=1 Tax=Candidatus Sungiibacteriota bacterium TaxID=2750080 RepID=A0A932YWM4_9BACT|nr:SDR family oxidoreductase [Candidatus Sungbacteria bacterium]MBI4132259.1 SDR family oxidoreductase [Candidatus Sungbacteria bacterium]